MWYRLANFIILINAISLSFQKKVESLFGDLYDKDIFAGYLKTDVDGNDLFYIFTPSQSGNVSDPVLLWLNGGPGCSSLFGLLGEIGPVTTDLFSNKFTLNNFSWNKNAHTIFIESPAGVGFSKVADPKQDYNDEKTAKGTFTALKNFFSEFPDYAKNEFFISGESYAGVYIPKLAEVIAADESKSINLKGVLVGNGLTDFETDIENSMVEFGFWHSLVSTDTWWGYLKNCPHLDPESNEDRNVTHKCNEYRDEIRGNFYGLDVYGIYRQCPIEDSKENSNKGLSMKKGILNSLSRALKKKSDLEPESPLWPTLCVDDYTADKFLNKKEIKEKLGVPDVNWTQCNGDINEHYTMSESLDFYKTFPEKYPDKRVWFFSGDTDAVLPTLGSMRWIQKLEKKVTKEYTQWTVKGQVAGYAQEYENGFVFVTVRGAGHMVPQDKREESKKMLDFFLEGKFPEKE